MRAIMIDEEQFIELLDYMKLKCQKIANTPPSPDINDAVWKSAVGAAHQSMHYEFVRWAQSHGASCTRDDKG